MNKVFISHSSKDKPAVEALARALHDLGVPTWFDKWEIGPGDDIVAKINAGLDECQCGLIVFSKQSWDSLWVRAESSYLQYARVVEGKVLIPVVVDGGSYLPPLLRPLARRGIEEVEAIADAVLGRKMGPPPVRPAEHGEVERVLIGLRRQGDKSIAVSVRHNDRVWAETAQAGLPREVIEAQAAFLHPIRHGLVRDASAIDRQAAEASLAELGRGLGALCLPGDSGGALAGLIDGAPVGTTIEVVFEADEPRLLGLPFEALRLPDDRLLAIQPAVAMLRRPLGLPPIDGAALAGPLKILVAIGAPDADKTKAAVLDLEREMQTILDAVEPAQRLENVEVRILEVGHPDAIGAALKTDAYHVLHLSCHGAPGALELEDEDGSPVTVAAEALLKPIRDAGRPLPLVLLNACHGGVQEGETASLAEALLRAGVPAVLAMQTSVTDRYATLLAGGFYENLAKREMLLASRALADARKALEQARHQAVQQGAGPGETHPEYATAALYVRGEERRLADFAADKQPLRVRPVYQVAGPVPQLGMDDLIGRRKELRQTLQTLRDGKRAGVVLTGIGGVGKSAIAGRAMVRLAEDGWLVPAHGGRFDVGAIAATVGVALLEGGRNLDKHAAALLRTDLDDQVRLQLVGQALAQHPILLVLDDFEQNLAPGGSAFLDPDVETWLGYLAQNARDGRLLITCRYPVPGADAYLARIAVGPLSPAESRKLILRLPALRKRAGAELGTILRVIGGHPRMLEFLDAVLVGGGRDLPHLTEKLQQVAAANKIDLSDRAIDGLDEGLQLALMLGARDVFLQELLDLAREEAIDAVLLQAAASNLPTSPAGLARSLAGGEAAAGDAAAVEKSVQRLGALSLLHRFPDGTVWVHRWTAEGLASLVDAGQYRAACIRAGRYRMWRVEHESHDIGDAIEAVRNFLAGKDFDSATEIASLCFDAFRRFRQTLSIAALAAEVLERLPEEHGSYAVIADEEAQAHLALGLGERALARYRAILQRYERLVAEAPNEPLYQHTLSVFYERVGDLYRALGQGAEARAAFLQSQAIAERLAAAEPDRADYQRDLSVSLNKLGDLYRALGQGAEARAAFLQSQAIAERLAAAEPDRADYQRDLSVSLNKLGDLYRVLGQGAEARAAFLQSQAIAERLAAAEPERADYQRDLSVSYERVGDLYLALGQGAEARAAFLQSQAIRERLAAAEPDRADYQRDLAVSYERVGDLYLALGQGAEARAAFLQSQAIRERLAAAEPDRADYQRDLSVSLNKLGDLYLALGQGAEARAAFLQSQAIRERLAAAEPERADYQRDLSVSYERVGDLYLALGQGAEARAAFLQSQAIRERLAAAEPDRADYQRDLAVSYERVGDLYLALGQGAEARAAFLQSQAIAERLAAAEPDRADYQRDLSVSLNKLGDLYLALGQGAEARAAFLQSQAIRERLAAAEPERADYQRDLIISMVKLAEISEGQAAVPFLARAMQIAEALAASGRLAPADVWMPGKLREMLGAAQGAGPAS